jgi:sterol desaturase/sphingolipid hydroxylase (fatty acid hydroxylase superfamily)
MSPTLTPIEARELPEPDLRTFRSAVPPAPRREPVARGRRPFRDALALLAAVAVVLALIVDVTPLFVVLGLFVVVVPFEMMFPRHGRRLRRPQLGTDIAHALLLTPLGVVGTAVAAVLGIASLAWLPGLALRPLVSMAPPIVRALIGLVLFDVVVYWAHRWAHEVPFLWRFHSLHHSTRRLDWVSGFRNHPFDGVFLAPAFVLLAAAGFSAEFTGVLAVIQLLTGLFAHANVRWRLRPLHRIVFTPEFHHWHHADEPGAINSNYSVFLPLWDTLFGTYFMPTDRRPQHYGIAEPTPSGIVRQLLHPFRGLRTPRQLLRHPWRSARETVAALRRGVRQMWRAARRPSHRRAPHLSTPSYTGADAGSD